MYIFNWRYVLKLLEDFSNMSTKQWLGAEVPTVDAFVQRTITNPLRKEALTKMKPATSPEQLHRNLNKVADLLCGTGVDGAMFSKRRRQQLKDEGRETFTTRELFAELMHKWVEAEARNQKLQYIFAKRAFKRWRKYSSYICTMRRHKQHCMSAYARLQTQRRQQQPSSK